MNERIKEALFEIVLQLGFVAVIFGGGLLIAVLMGVV